MCYRSYRCDTVARPYQYWSPKIDNICAPVLLRRAKSVIGVTALLYAILHVCFMTAKFVITRWLVFILLLFWTLFVVKYPFDFSFLVQLFWSDIYIISIKPVIVLIPGLLGLDATCWHLPSLVFWAITIYNCCFLWLIHFCYFLMIDLFATNLFFPFLFVHLTITLPIVYINS